MRLASKIFLASSLVILVLAGVGALSLGAVGRLVSVNREITTQTVPALRVSSGLRDQMLSLARLEARYSVLKDARYATAWRARAAQADDEFDRLRTLVRTPRERALLAETAAVFDAYRDAVAAEQARPSRERTLEEPPSRALGERVEEALERLMGATYARGAGAQAEAARLAARTWAGALNAKQARLVTVIGHSTDRLLRLVNQMLELSRLRAGVLPLARERVDLASVVGRAVEELRPQAEEGALTLTRERVGDRFDARGDEDRLVQVVVNLVANAVRFTPRGGRVTVRLIDAGPEIAIQVEDTGVGIPAAALPPSFQSWRPAHNDRGGTGLGLAVVRGIVQAHGGRVTVESQEGKGIRFTVLVPREP